MHSTTPRAATAIALIAGAVLAATALALPAQAAELAAAPTGGIEGTLVAGGDATSGAPVAITVQQVGVDRPLIVTTTATLGGGYSVPGLAPGSYTVIARGDGLGAASGDAPSFALAAPVTVAAAVVDVDLTVLPSAIITGSVDAAGAPVDASALLTVYRSADGERWQPVASTTGWSSFRFGDTLVGGWLAPGRYVVGASETGSAAPDAWGFCEGFTSGATSLDAATPFAAAGGASTPVALHLGVVGSACTPSALHPGSVHIQGDAVVGSTVTARATGFTPAPDRLTYQWYVDGEPLSGATGSTMLVGSAFAGQRITVAVTAAATGFRPLAAVSAIVVPTAQGVASGPDDAVVADAPPVTAPAPAVGASAATVGGGTAASGTAVGADAADSAGSTGVAASAAPDETAAVPASGITVDSAPTSATLGASGAATVADPLAATVAPSVADTTPRIGALTPVANRKGLDLSGAAPLIEAAGGIVVLSGIGLGGMSLLRRRESKTGFGAV